MTVMPLVFGEIAFTRDASGYPLWQDVSDFVEWEKSVKITRRRSHELDEVQPGTLSLSLINTDGRFTADRAASPYYPSVTLNRPIRIRVRWPGSVNLLLKGQAEGSNAALFSATTGSLAANATAPAGQTSSIRWSASSWASGDMIRIGTKAITTATDEAIYVTAGVTYSARCQARRETNAATMAVRLRWYDKNGAFLSENTGSGVALTTSFQAVSVSAAAPASALFARVVFVATAAATSAAVLSSAWQLEKAASPTAWVTPGNEYRRFTGFVDRWPHAWTQGVLGAAQITATDRQKLLARATLRGGLPQEILGSDPVCYYPLSEPEGATQAGNLATTSQPDMVIQQSGNDGTLAFGAPGGPDESSGVLLTPSDITRGKLLLVSALTTPVGGVPGISIAIWVNFGATPQTGQNRLIYVDDGTDTVHFRVNYAPGTNTLTVGVRVPGGSVAGSTTSFNLDDNQLHLVVATAEFIAGTVRIRSYIDGVMGIDTSPALTGSTWPLLTRIRVGGLPATALDPAEMMSGLVSQVAAWNSVLTLAQSQSLSNARDGFAGELSGARAERIAAWAGLTATAFDPGSSLMDKHPHQDQAVLASFKQVAFSEAGIFFISGDDVAVLYGRDRRQFPPSAAITLTADQLGADLQFLLDDQLLINDVSVSRSGRTVTRVTDEASIAEHEGTYSASLDTLLYSDIEALDRASYTLYTYGHPQPRAGQISVDAHSIGTVWDQMLGSEIGQRISITNLPAEAPATALDLWCEGVEDVITDCTWSVNLDTSPFRNAPVFILDDPDFCTLDNNYLGW